MEGKFLLRFFRKKKFTYGGYSSPLTGAFAWIFIASFLAYWIGWNASTALWISGISLLVVLVDVIVTTVVMIGFPEKPGVRPWAKRK